MKKICVVTWYGGTNYGTNLQAYALVKKLELMGYDTKIKGNISKNINYFFYPYLVFDRINNKIKRRKNNKIIYEVDRDTQKFFNEFIKEKLPKLNSYGREEWGKIEKDYTAFITGSDQVWNPNYFQASMMLDFIPHNKIKKIAYAPSIGVNSLSKKIKRKYKRLLKKYEAISVREEQAAKILQDISPVSVKVVLDPTMLLTCEEWNELTDEANINRIEMLEEKYIVCYFVGDRKDYIRYVEKVKNETGMKCFVIPINNNVKMENCITLTGIGPKEFIWMIKHASIILTDSFHASVFSILYHKEFYVLKRFPENSATSQNSRLHQILDMYKLSNRWIEDESQFIRDIQINYDITDKILEKKRKFSEEFLTEAIEKRGRQNENL